MSHPRPIQANGRHDRALEAFPDLSSFRSGSPFAQEILARDLASCFEDHDRDAHDADDEELSDAESDFDARPHRASTAENAPILHGNGRPNGVAFGSSRPTIAFGESSVVPDSPLLTARELVESRAAERSLLRDNHILPPKHPRPQHETWTRRVYREIFSTKVRKNSDAAAAGGLSSRSRVSTKEIDESSPLLLTVNEIGTAGAYDSIPPTPGTELQIQWGSAVSADVLRTTWQREAKTLAQYAGPLILTFLLHYSVQITSVFTIGRIGTVELAAVSLAGMTANISCYAPIQGLATCLDTLCAQAYGSGHKHLVGLQLQRMTVLLWILLIPICTLWWFADSILAEIMPDPRTAALAGLYMKVLILGTPGVAAFESGKRFVQSQGLFHATTYVLLIGAPLNVFISWFFVWKMGWGFVGAASAVVFTQNLLPILLVLYVIFVEGSECWNGFSRRAFTNWWPMLKLALPGMIMVEAQYFAFELLTMMAGQFGTSQLAAQSILVTCTSTTFNVPFPLSIAASTRVANLIGARLSGAAKTSARVALMSAIVVGLCNLTLLSSLRYWLPTLFTQDSEVISIVAKVAPTCAVMQIVDALAAMSHGLLRGIGRQSVGSWTNLGSYYLVAVPISISTGFLLDWKLEGLWFGIMTGLICVSTIELFYLWQADWEHAVEEAELRMRSDHEGYDTIPGVRPGPEVV